MAKISDKKLSQLMVETYRITIYHTYVDDLVAGIVMETKLDDKGIPYTLFLVYTFDEIIGRYIQLSVAVDRYNKLFN